MNHKTRYLLSLSGLAIVAALSTIYVQQRRAERVDSQELEKRVASLVEDVKSPAHLRQVEIIIQKIRKNQAPSEEQLDQLSAVVGGPPDKFVQARASAALMDGVKRNFFSSTQKSKIAATAIGALNNPELLSRLYCVRLLGRLREPSAVPVLLPLLNAPEDNMRKAVRKALDQLQKPATT